MPHLAFRKPWATVLPHGADGGARPALPVFTGLNSGSRGHNDNQPWVIQLSGWKINAIPQLFLSLACLPLFFWGSKPLFELGGVSSWPSVTTGKRNHRLLSHCLRQVIHKSGNDGLSTLLWAPGPWCSPPWVHGPEAILNSLHQILKAHNFSPAVPYVGQHN